MTQTTKVRNDTLTVGDMIRLFGKDYEIQSVGSIPGIAGTVVLGLSDGHDLVGLAEATNELVA